MDGKIHSKMAVRYGDKEWWFCYIEEGTLRLVGGTEMQNRVVPYPCVVGKIRRYIFTIEVPH